MLPRPGAFGKGPARAPGGVAGPAGPAFWRAAAYAC